VIRSALIVPAQRRYVDGCRKTQLDAKVDITTLRDAESGQMPLHAFDLAEIKRRAFGAYGPKRAEKLVLPRWAGKSACARILWSFADHRTPTGLLASWAASNMASAKATQDLFLEAPFLTLSLSPQGPG